MTSLREYTLINKINAIIANLKKPQIKISDINSDSDICLLCDLDSLEFMEFIIAVEKEFDIEFRDDIEFERLNNINIHHFLNYIQKIIKKF